MFSHSLSEHCTGVSSCDQNMVCKWWPIVLSELVVYDHGNGFGCLAVDFQECESRGVTHENVQLVALV